MRKLLLIIFFTAGLQNCFSQMTGEEVSALKTKLSSTGSDSAKLKICFDLSTGYRFSNIDSSFYYNDMAFSLAKKINDQKYQAHLLSLKGATLLESGSLPESM